LQGQTNTITKKKLYLTGKKSKNDKLQKKLPKPSKIKKITIKILKY
jgi:hypothetical protein